MRTRDEKRKQQKELNGSDFRDKEKRVAEMKRGERKMTNEVPK